MRAILIGVLSAFFFAFTFVLNRSMEAGGGSWIWSASLRYLFMVPLLWALVWMRGGIRPLLADLRQRPGTWLLWSVVGFGLFYAPISFAAAYGPAWLVASTWQVTIICGSLLVPLFYDVVQTAEGPRRVRQKIPMKGLAMSLIILLGVAVMQVEHAQDLTLTELLLGFVPVLVAAFAYPLGNRKMMAVLDGRLDAFQRALGMTLGSLPVWILLSVYGLNTVGAPSGDQALQSLIVAVSSGVIATVLFFSATDLAKGNPVQMAAVEATQSVEVIFTVLGEILLLSILLPSFWSWTGMALVMGGMVLHSYVSHGTVKAPESRAKSV